MNAYQLGEAYARNMGVNISRFRVELILLSSVLSACVTAFAGSHFFCGYCSATADEESSENGKTDPGDPGMFRAELRFACSVISLPGRFFHRRSSASAR